MLERGFVGMGADEFVAKGGNDFGELLFHFGLGRPTGFVGGLAEVAVGDEIDRLFREFFHGFFGLFSGVVSVCGLVGAVVGTGRDA